MEIVIFIVISIQKYDLMLRLIVNPYPDFKNVYERGILISFLKKSLLNSKARTMMHCATPSWRCFLFFLFAAQIIDNSSPL